MITYELCKQLKDAGFPQKEVSPDLLKVRPELIDNDIYIPSLLELIEEICKNGGERYFRLVRDDDGWRARNIQVEGQFVNWCRSPEEAVAHLYLELNKK